MNARLLFALNAVLLVLLAMSVPFIERGTDTFVISVLSFVVIVLSMSGLGVVILYQRKRDKTSPNERL